MEINRKLDLQVASLKTLLESLKLQTIRYLAGETGAVLLCVCDGGEDEHFSLADAETVLLPVSTTFYICPQRNTSFLICVDSRGRCSTQSAGVGVLKEYCYPVNFYTLCHFTTTNLMFNFCDKPTQSST